MKFRLKDLNKLNKFTSSLKSRKDVFKSTRNILDKSCKSPSTNVCIPLKMCDQSIMTWALNPSHIIEQVWKKYDISRKSILPFCSYTPERKLTTLEPSLEIKDAILERQSPKYSLRRNEAKSVISNY